jgi:hypothetical protein
MAERSSWNTPMPPLDEIKAAADRLATAAASQHRFDVAEVTICLNGQHGGWDVTMKATDQDMQDVVLTGILGRYGALEDLTEAGA